MNNSNYKHTVNAVCDVLKFAWKHRKGGKNILVIRAWVAITITLISGYSLACYADSQGNWAFGFSTASLGYSEVAFFLVATLGAIYMLYIFNMGQVDSSEDISQIKKNTTENLYVSYRTLDILNNNNSHVIKHLLPGLRDAINQMKVKTAYNYLLDIKKESEINYKKDKALMSSIEFNLGQCARYISDKDCKTHYRESYRLMKLEGDIEYEILEAMVYVSCKEKKFEEARAYAEDLKDLDNDSEWTIIPDLMTADNLHGAYLNIPQNIDRKKAIAIVVMLGGGKDHDLGVDVDTYKYNNLKTISPENFAFWILDLSIALTRFIRTFVYQEDVRQMDTRENQILFTMSNDYLCALRNTELDNLLTDIEFVHELSGYIHDKDIKRIDKAKAAKYTPNMKELYHCGMAIMLCDAKKCNEALGILRNYGDDASSSIFHMRLQMATFNMDLDEMVATYRDAFKKQCSIPDHHLNFFLGVLKGHYDKVGEYALELNIENPISKRIIEEYVYFLRGDKTDVEWIQEVENIISPIFTPYIACIYKDKLGLDRGIALLEKCVDRTVLDVRSRLLIDFMRENIMYTSKLYHLLQDIRHTSSKIEQLDPQLLSIELHISEQIQDFANSREVTEQMQKMMPENDSVIAHHVMALARCGGKETEINSYKKRIEHAHLNNWELITVVNVFQSIGEVAFAVELLYQAIKRTNDQSLKDTYIGKHLQPAIDSIISEEKDVVELTDFVTIEISGKTSEVEITPSSIYEVLVGKCKNDVCIINIKNEEEVKICEIRNKYYKLIRDIFRELEQTNASKNMRMFSTDDFDFKNDPLGALAKMAGITPDVIEAKKKALDIYKKGDASLMKFVKSPGTFADLYDKIFGDFSVCTHPNSIISNIFSGENVTDKFSVVLDITSLIVLHEYDIRYGLGYKKRFYISNGLVNFLKMEILNEEKGLYAFITDAVRKKIIIRTEDEGKTDLYNKLKMIESWVYEHCNILVVEERLDIDFKFGKDTLSDLALESIILASRGHILLTEDWTYVKLFMNYIRSMSTYNWLYLTNEELVDEFSTMMLENGNVGYDMKSNYLSDQYDLFVKNEPNCYNTCIANINYLPEAPEIVISACKLMLNGILTSARIMSVTNLLILMLKTLRQETARQIIQRECTRSADKVYHQCLRDALKIAHPLLIIPFDHTLVF